MTTPCSVDDLPTPYEPIINFLGSPTPAYTQATDELTVLYSFVECLNLNPGYALGQLGLNDQMFFFGELIPPYIDILGRGAYFRACDSASVKFQTTARCYMNKNPFGTAVYQRVVNYYGP